LDFTDGADSTGAFSTTGVDTSATGTTGTDAGEVVSASDTAPVLAAVLAGAFFAVDFDAPSSVSPSASDLAVFFGPLVALVSSG